MFRVHHFNFSTVYEFNDILAAKKFTEQQAFEAVIYCGQVTIWFYSPISGWRKPLPVAIMEE